MKKKIYLFNGKVKDLLNDLEEEIEDQEIREIVNGFRQDLISSKEV